MTKKRGRVGSSFEDHLREQGILQETTAVAVKRVLAWQLEKAMEKSSGAESPQRNHGDPVIARVRIVTGGDHHQCGRWPHDTSVSKQAQALRGFFDVPLTEF